ncbi:hypothetical protein CR66_05910 [Campylobacter mucosalis]|uniref:hypothetical protein n=1 Tax=Campylobacter mucosalis TaxID=202 RepID=UPI0004D9820F|nr:hypothetical protein [Campylobacter mucosalis]KEA45686.1 hypothetical protein CR66_05910 [Campylobacter mucosalis]QKF63455.1 glutamine amidotransferase-like domain-containing protein [Campylobacter mucosalis]
MNIAVVMYDKMNLIGFSQILGYLRTFENARIKTCAFKPEIVDEFGLKIQPEIYGESLYGADMIVVPDGIGALNLRHDEIFLSWIRSGSSSKIKFGFDLGVLILAGAGFLQGRQATIRRGYKNALSEYCGVVDTKICENGGILSVSEWGDDIKERLAQILA